MSAPASPGTWVVKDNSYVAKRTILLIERGWICTKKPGHHQEWRNPRFGDGYPWPFMDAVRLEQEADNGNVRALLLLERSPA